MIFGEGKSLPQTTGKSELLEVSKGRRLIGPDFNLHQENTTRHTVKIVIRYLSGNLIKYLNGPPQIPDLLTRTCKYAYPKHFLIELHYIELLLPVSFPGRLAKTTSLWRLDCYVFFFNALLLLFYKFRTGSFFIEHVKKCILNHEKCITINFL